MARMPGEITFAINRSLVGAGVVASDAEVAAAVAFAFSELKLVVEPGGAVALAALMTRQGRRARQGRRRRPLRRQYRSRAVFSPGGVEPTRQTT